ncbi:hypothetical protein HPB47_010312 [Ixodes persulcatus]|uniref:Uncharacterized protein n=1 Tax=Ixodes persulcatus TaxID=34615 RepID=A0AC60NZG6_IXOPE|nr:hypothetical protein HPB47_010312 [Ixodes persulcatus]
MTHFPGYAYRLREDFGWTASASGLAGQADFDIRVESRPSGVLRAICNHKTRLLPCSAEDPGLVHDARVYRRSGLPTILTADKIPFDNHLLGA